jgi:hypothetical protein
MRKQMWIGGALLAAALLTGCAIPPGVRTGQMAVGEGVPVGPAGPVQKPSSGQVLWHQPCNSVGSFGERLSVDQCGHGGFPFVD